MDKALHDLLYYYQEDGYEGYDLREVQLLNVIDAERVEKLKVLLQHEDPYVAYQAMLILLAWAVPEGFVLLDRFIAEQWETTTSFEPHRLYGADNVYDVIADALSVATLNGKSVAELYPYLQQLLSMYGTHFFESCLAELLLRKDCRPLLKDMETAMEQAIAQERYYQASQLFPVLVHYDKQAFEQYNALFLSLTELDKRIAFNTAAALAAANG